MDVHDRIDRILATNAVVLFMRGTPERPMCQGSADCVHVLSRCNATYHAVDLRQDPELRAFLPKFSDQDSFPQLFLHGELIGGADIVRDLAEQGELALMVNSRSRDSAAALATR